MVKKETETVKCKVCKGTGLQSPDQSCPKCEGMGTVPK